MRNLPLILVGLLVLAGLGGLLLLSSGAQDRRLDASVIGLAALEPWLDRQGLAAEQANPRIRPDITQIGLRLLPLARLHQAVDQPDGNVGAQKGDAHAQQQITRCGADQRVGEDHGDLEGRGGKAEDRGEAFQGVDL